jgi:hypothetical protein
VPHSTPMKRLSSNQGRFEVAALMQLKLKRCSSLRRKIEYSKAFPNSIFFKTV